GIPADAATDKWAERFGNLPRCEVATADQVAGLGVDILDEVDVLDEPPDILHAEIAVIDEDEAALVGMHQQLLTISFQHHELADSAVEVPGVMRQLLMIGLQLAGIDIKGDYRGGIEVVTGTGALRLEIGARPVVERRRVGGAPVDCVGLGIEGARHPASPSARAPPIVTPRLHG